MVTRPRHKWIVLPLAALLAAGAVLWLLWDEDPDAETERLAQLLGIEPGMTVAEIGAGSGAMAAAMARRVAPGGKVIATEIDKTDLEEIQRLAQEEELVHLSVLEGAVDATNLPAGCCDAAYMRKVYHHFTNPAPLTRDLLAAVKPGSPVAVIDFEAAWFLPAVDGVPKDRGGHGVPRELVIKEMQAAGFEFLEDVPGWPSPRLFCLVFRKPGDAGSEPAADVEGGLPASGR